MDDIKIFDSTLRDGSHAIRHALSATQVGAYCRAVDNAGMHVVIVGHGNGLGASSLQVGLSKTSDNALLRAARSNLKHTRLGVFLLPGFGTLKDDLQPAFDLGADVACIASHCTEADVTAQYIAYAAKQKKEAYGILMMYHMAAKDRLLAEAKKMADCGARGVIIMDSAGTSTPALVKETVSCLAEHLPVPVGFHAHNNLGMAVAHTWLALEAGARIVDGTLRGFGAGAGNCPIEVLAALLVKMGYSLPVNVDMLMDAGDEVARTLMKKPQEIDSVSIASGLAGVFSGFALPVKRAAETFGVSARDIFKELGKRHVIGGQEDMVIEIAMALAKLTKSKSNKAIKQ
ncbi:MAG: 4-hydroxy-2-oxovalerate aldolase [Candidatus Harrisonbacteria bacterium]|nr:4-hydroxy-2-oxovalerate aldolase [Candidatus Harrisonbacteria bacterium]